MAMNPTIYYRHIKILKLDIEALSNKIILNKYKRIGLIKRAAPGALRSYSFDSIKECKKIINDADEIEKIRKITAEIDMDQMLYDEKVKSLEQLKDKGVKVATELKDLVLRVFIMAYIDDKKNEEIAQELGYAVHSIENVKYEINKIFSEIDIN